MFKTPEILLNGFQPFWIFGALGLTVLQNKLSAEEPAGMPLATTGVEEPEISLFFRIAYLQSFNSQDVLANRVIAKHLLLLNEAKDHSILTRLVSWILLKALEKNTGSLHLRPI